MIRMPRFPGWAGLACAAILLFAGATATDAKADNADPPFHHGLVEKRLSAPEARQGVASDGQHVYVIDNSRIGKYAIATGRKDGEFAGDPAQFPHLNSCAVVGARLVCASSNYPATPHRGTVEFFDPATMTHVQSVALAQNPGSLTALARHDGRWWAAFAHYDGKGGIAGCDHGDTQVAELDNDFRIRRTWSLPASVLARLAPYSLSGLTWGDDGRIYASGHDKPEIYVLSVPDKGTRLRHHATWAVASFGQAIAFDPAEPRLLWTIDRATRSVFAHRLPAMPDEAGTTQDKQP